VTVPRRRGDRNRVVFGIPQPDVEQEFGRVWSELEARTSSVEQPRTRGFDPPPAPPASTVEPLRSYTYLTGPLEHYLSVDQFNDLGAGAGTLWFAANRNIGFQSSFFANQWNANYAVYSYDPSTRAVELREPVTVPPGALNFNAFRGGASKKHVVFGDGGSILSEFQSATDSPELLGSGQPLDAVSANEYNLPRTSTIPGYDFAARVYQPVNIGGVRVIGTQFGEVYTPSTDSWTTIAPPAGTGTPRFVMHGDFMWCARDGMLYAASSSLTPDWQLRYDDSPAISIVSDNLKSVNPSTGSLVRVVDDGGSGTIHRKVVSHDFTTGDITERPAVFSPSGNPTGATFGGTASREPRTDFFYVKAYAGYLIFNTIVRADALGRTTAASSANADLMWVNAVWAMRGDGASLPTEATLVATSPLDWPAPDDPSDFFRYHWAAGAVSGGAIYTYTGGVQVGGTAPAGDRFTQTVSSLIRRHAL